MIKNHTNNYVPSMGTAVVWRTDAVGIAYMNRRSAYDCWHDLRRTDGVLRVTDHTYVENEGYRSWV